MSGIVGAAAEGRKVEGRLHPLHSLLDEDETMAVRYLGIIPTV